MRNYTFRLTPGQDLFNAIEMFTKKQNIEAGCILSAVGSLTRLMLRFANQELSHEETGHFEIVSITGTVSILGSHLHLSAADEQGRTIGGHLVSGCLIYTTAEIGSRCSRMLSTNGNSQKIRGTRNWLCTISRAQSL